MADSGGVSEIPDGSESSTPRYWRTAARGPRILFFSGGSALRGVARALKRSTWNSIHIVTPFDSGGSSARIREAFHMLSVGDLRNRLLTLADEGDDGDAALYHMLAFRLPIDGDATELRERLARIVDGDDPLIEPVGEPARSVMREMLGSCAEILPGSFDLRGASIGNLVLAGGYLREGRTIGPVIETVSEHIRARGIVCPVTAEDLHIGARLRDGSEIIGQHRLTGKQSAPITSPIEDIYLMKDGERAVGHASAAALELIASADMIGYPMGSFFSSVLCNLLPRGVGRAIAASAAPKVFLPNAGTDPEQLGMSVEDAVHRIVGTVRRDAGADTPEDRILNTVILDPHDDLYTDAPVGSLPDVRLALAGFEVLRMPLADARPGTVRYDAGLLSEALLSLA